jgi:oxygen-dependent protoporphyrinogen oxidase
MLFNPANPMRRGPRRPGGSLIVYAAGDSAAEVLPLSDAAITERFLSDLYQVVPGVKGNVREVMVKRWALGVPVAEPGRARLQRHLAAPYGRIFFAGDYLIDPGMDSAAWTAEVAVNDLRRVLDGQNPAFSAPEFGGHLGAGLASRVTW